MISYDKIVNSYSKYKLYYIHGYLSNPDGIKANLLKNKLGVIPIKYRDCAAEDIIISECLNEINHAVSYEQYVGLIGSSLGGFLAAKTALECNISLLILLNPAIIPPYVDIKKIDDMPQRILRDMQDKQLFSIRMKSKIIIFLGTKDTVVPNSWGIDFARFQEAEIHFFNDDHRFSDNIKQLPDLIKDVLK